MSALRRAPSALRGFFESETAGGLLLMGVAALALVIANSPLSSTYFALLHAPLGGLDVRHWINDGLMAVFFLLVGLEIKRELIDGELSSWPRRALPGIAAAGGMLVPALVYVAFQPGGSETLRGWAIPAATDIAFALGVLSLLGPRVPVSLKVFLTALAIIDDLGAVAIIAVFFTHGLQPWALGAAGAVFVTLVLMNRLKVKALTPYLIGGAALWWFTLQSGVHATLAGVALALTIPLQPSPGAPEHATSPLHRLEHAIQPWVAFAVTPIFGFANAGVSFAGLSPAAAFAPLPLGVAAGLFVGKQLGVFGSVWLAVRFGLADRPGGASWRQVYGVALLCGVGFTMSLFIGALAFDAESMQDAAKLGVLVGSALSALAGAAVLAWPGGPGEGRRRAGPFRNSFAAMKSFPLRLLAPVLAAFAFPAVAMAAAPGLAAPKLLGAPIEFYLFGLTLLGIAVFHHRTLMVAVMGLCAILTYQATVSGFPTGFGAGALLEHLGHEWVVLTNLLLLLVGFEVLSNQFELSNLPDHMPGMLPDGWLGSFCLLVIVFVMSAFLDNIAATVIGGVVARHVYQGRVTIGFLAAIVAAANAGGAGSVIGDTTTTMMWLNGVSPLSVIHAYVGSLAAFLVFASLGATFQHRHQACLDHDEPGHPIRWRRVVIVGVVLLAAVATNVAANTLSSGEETAPWLGIAIWVALILTAFVAKPDWSVVKPGLRGAAFLLSLVAAASLMPVRALPDASPGAALGLGFLSAVFDNIPLTALALEQGGYDWGLLAYAVGFGGSMVWFGSSAGVALTNLYPEGRSVFAWLKQAWYVPVAYVVGFAALVLLLGWRPEAAGG